MSKELPESFKLNWYGSMGAGGGYSGSAENMILALTKEGIDVRTVRMDEGQSSNLSAEFREATNKPFELAEVGLCYSNPCSFSSLINKVKVGFTMFETDKLPVVGVRNCDWVKECNKLDLLLVPCEHNIKLFKKSGVKVPIKKVLLGYNPDEYSILERPKKKKFVFLMLGTLTLRKNPGAVLSAFLDLFKGNNDVELMLKTQSGTLGHIRFPEYKNIKIVDRLSTKKEMIDYYQNADCFVLPSRGEGFGLPIVEAMATGLPTIFTDNTGMSEFADKKYNYPVKVAGKSKAIRFPESWGDVGNWYETDYDDLKKKMLYVYKHQQEARKRGQMASQWVKNNFTFQHTAKQIIKALKECD